MNEDPRMKEGIFTFEILYAKVFPAICCLKGVPMPCKNLVARKKNDSATAQ